MEKELVEEKLAAFSRKTLQGALTVHIVLETEGISYEELEEYLEGLRKKVKNLHSERRREMEERRKEAEKQRIEWEQKTDKCPQCNTPLALTRIRTPKGPANKFGYRSLWICTKDDCSYEKYSKEVIEDIYDRIMRR